MIEMSLSRRQALVLGVASLTGLASGCAAGGAAATAAGSVARPVVAGGLADSFPAWARQAGMAVHDGAVYDVAKKLGGYALQAVEVLREAGGDDNPGGWLGIPGGSVAGDDGALAAADNPSTGQSCLATSGPAGSAFLPGGAALGLFAVTDDVTRMMDDWFTQTTCPEDLPAIRATMNTRASMALLPSGQVMTSGSDTSFHGDFQVTYQSRDGRGVKIRYWYAEDRQLGAVAVRIQGLSEITSWVDVPRVVAA